MYVCMGPSPAPLHPIAGGPRPEALLDQIRSLHRAREAAARELAEAQGHSAGLHRHLQQLEERQAALERLWQQKQEALRVARLRRAEVEAEGQRHRGRCLSRQQEVAGAGEQRSRLRLQRRGHREQFWRQLEDIMEQHKRLREEHVPAHLEAELERLEEAMGKLLSQERRLLEAEQQLGPEAFVAIRLVEEEAEWAGQRLAAELARRQSCQCRRDRLAGELEQLQRPLEAQRE
ncbi:synaptonemal complex central element protein 1-like isoform X1 [Neopsephotus bourkii]|uniref:synaptonemal complex central element protein 1-like isoform X1 n=1 Tax=Neopsephotus bourkii TaxID=309878 RepID=UPI002AA5C78E|nr:synaptonemal complex central element protein 1-like isoform X1 [Neopsephotus bourkii]